VDWKATTCNRQSFSCSTVLTRSTTTGTLLLDLPSPEGKYNPLMAFQVTVLHVNMFTDLSAINITDLGVTDELGIKSGVS